jgi:hypothetical protein
VVLQLLLLLGRPGVHQLLAPGCLSPAGCLLLSLPLLVPALVLSSLLLLLLQRLLLLLSPLVQAQQQVLLLR